MIKYSTRGGVEWQIQHKAKPNAVFAMRSHPECCILSYNTSVYSAFTDLLVLYGKTDYLCFKLRFGRKDSQRC